MNKYYLYILSFFLVSLYSQEESMIAGRYFDENHKLSINGSSPAPNQEFSTKTTNPHSGYCELDFLWWKLKRPGYSYMYIPDDGTHYNCFDFPSIVGTLLEGKSKFSPGFRIETTFANLYDWMIGGIFTYYQNSFQDHPKTAKTMFHPGMDLRDLKVHFHLTYWTADVVLSTHFALNKSASITPFMGIKGAQISYHSDIDFSGWFLVFLYPEYYNETFRSPYKFFGCGPNIGLKTFYEFNHSGFTLFGTLAASLLYGKVNARNFSFKKHSFPPIYPEVREIEDWHNHFNDLKSNLQLQLGAFWKHYYDCNTKAFKMGINWEANYWWNIKDYFGGPETERYIVMLGLNAFFGCEF